MVAETELRLRQGMPVMDIVQYRCVVSEIAAAATAAAPSSESAELVQELDLRDSDAVLDIHAKVDSIDFVPSIRSGSFADIGNRTYMEDEHLCVDDLAAHLGSRICCPTPSAFYGVFDGHGGPESAIFLREHAMKFFFEDSDFPRSSEADDVFLQKAELSLSKSFLLVDDALADDLSISSSSGTTGLTVLLFGRVLLVANVGDCRAVLCRKGEAIDMSEDHRPVRLSELRRVEAAGGYIDDGYLNGVLSVTRALGDWDVKFPRGSSSPLIADPEFRQAVLTEEDEFLIIGCDGIWDVMSSQHAVGIVRRGLRRHDDPAKCARELVLEALRLNTSDNLTAIVVCFTAEQEEVCFTSEQRDTSSALASPQQMGPRRPRLRCCSLSAEALCKLNSWLNDTANN